MPLFEYACPQCAKKVRKILKAPQDQTCTCGTIMTRNASPPASSAVETLDNGLMPRQVTRIADAERIFKERADNDPRYKVSE